MGVSPVLCRYKCESCGDWHPLSNIPTHELMGAWFSFILSPPEPFGKEVWDMLFREELRRRTGGASGGGFYMIRL